MVAPIAIVGMACRYPDARSPDELWENVLAQRRAFRRIPPERLRLEDYYSPERDAPDCVYSTEAALIENYEFDRVGFRVSGAAYRAADLAHWLALDVASRALSDGGFDAGDLPHEQTAVFVGNTLTGEFSRANVMRLRWPYVRRVVEGALAEEGWAAEARAAFLGRLEGAYKKPFPPLGEESLAGGLSNTIAGRVCNHFDLKGGGYTIDGACASSLLAVGHACASLAAGDADVALAGGVDLSIDPFELVGFAKTGALASTEMLVYDAHSEGFWPGEGCGFVVLMRHEDALAQRRRVYALIRGWGVSSDGRGGITRPEVEGQVLALARAYRRADFGVETVGYFEGHGTGTAVGDAVELKALTLARRRAGGRAAPAAVGSVKANIGHTKAAAGVAGLIKAAMAVRAGILPPATGSREPHPEFNAEDAALRLPEQGELWAGDLPLRAGVSAMGFGGINTHVVIEGPERRRRASFSTKETTLLSSYQDAELLLLAARDREELRREVSKLAGLCGSLSRAEVGDLAAHLAQDLDPAAAARAALVASTPGELVGCLEKLSYVLESGARQHVDAHAGVSFGDGLTKPRIGLLFPGQGSPVYLDGGLWGRRFEDVRRTYASAGLPKGGRGDDTSVAQPAVVAASLAGLRMLEVLDVRAAVAVGHSLGELTALHWAGALDEEALLRLARARGEIMARVNGAVGAMASIAADRAGVEALLNGDPVVIAGVNAPSQTVISGEKSAVETVLMRARARDLSALMLPVSHAFHSPLVEAAAAKLSARLSGETLGPLRDAVVSTVTGSLLGPDEDLRGHLRRQVTSPVLFMDAAAAADAEGVALWVEVGPGHVLGGLASRFLKTPVVSLDAGGRSLRGLLLAAGAAFVLGSPTNPRRLFDGRFHRPFKLDRRPTFFSNPCEQAPTHAAPPPARAKEEAGAAAPAGGEGAAPTTAGTADGVSPLELFVRLIAERAELPPSAVRSSHRLLSDLHLNSITVTRLVAEAARRLGLPRPVAPTLYADATIGEVAEMLSRQLRAGPQLQEPETEGPPAGFGTWVRPYTVEQVERPLPRRAAPEAAGAWQVFAPRGYPFAETLRRAFAACGSGAGVVVCLPPEPDEAHVKCLLEAARAVLQAADGARFVLAQRGRVAASFARTLHLELKVTTAVVDVPGEDTAHAQLVVAEALAARGYAEACYDLGGKRSEPVVRPLVLAEPAALAALTADDVLVVTGGARGITAECVLALAGKTGARLALFGLSGPDSGGELGSNFERMAARGIRFKYYAVDVTDELAVGAAVSRVEAELGPVTGILHGAAQNEPLPLGGLDEGAVRRVLDVKVGGLRNLLASIDPERLRLLITFGSVIARSGLPGEAHYGLANAWLARATEEWQAARPSCRCLCVEWSVWSGVGMGARLGNMDALVRQGISPIPPGEGVEMFCRLVETKLPAVPVVVMGRMPDLPTFKLERPELPLLRFLEQPRVYYPQVEIVVDTELSASTDPYLDDHRLGGERLLPAVMGLEAMAQAAAALVSADGPPDFSDVTFYLPVVVPPSASTRIRVAALARGRGVVDVALRSEETDFQVEHFRATCLFGGAQPAERPGAQPPDAPPEGGQLDLDPGRDLYGSILFHRGRFRRLNRYRVLGAQACAAEIGPGAEAPWFGPYLPHRLLLGDPGARDAAIHAVQACIPHKRLLPVGAARISIDRTVVSGAAFIRARERWHEGDVYEYDLEVSDEGGGVRERWEGLRLRALEGLALPDPLPWPLLGPLVERRVRELVPASSLTVTVSRCRGAERRARSEPVLRAALGPGAVIHRRSDGAPEVAGAGAVKVSASHARDLTVAVAGPGPVGCDVEFVEQRPTSAWLDLLGDRGFRLAQVIADAFHEDEGVAATRVWVAAESLRKAAAALTPALVLTPAAGDGGGWVMLSAGHLAVATFVTRIRPFEEPLVVGVLAGAGGNHQQT
jgi:enediyne polyketide synthase